MDTSCSRSHYIPSSPLQPESVIIHSCIFDYTHSFHVQEPCATELSKTITPPFLCANGEPDKVKQMSVIGEKKVICTLPKNSSLCQGLIALICCYYLYQFEYPKNAHQLYVFLADKLCNAPLERKPTTVYKNFIGSVDI